MQEYDVVIIGSGPGGYVAAIRAGQLGLKTLCIEKDQVLGGTCLNVGCIPSKSLLQSSELYWKQLIENKDHGIHAKDLSFDFARMMQRKSEVIASFNKGIEGLFKKNHVEHLQGEASFIDAHTLAIANHGEVKAKNIIIATGSYPIELPFLPFDEKRIVSSTGALKLQEVPKKLIVIGGGVIGVELGSVYARLGSEVKIVEFLDHICPGVDISLSKALKKELEKQHLSFLLSTKVTGASIDQLTLSIEGAFNEELSADVILVCVGRHPNTQGLNLEKADISLDEKGFILTNGLFQTSQPHIYAIGDVTGPPMLAHKASEEGIIAIETIAGMNSTLDYIAIPNVIYTHPEVASVGLTQVDVKSHQLDACQFTFPMLANSRARCAGEAIGFVKLIARKKDKKLLGAHMIAPHAGELIQSCALALHKRLTAFDIAHTSHAHPTFSEAIKEAALGLIDSPIHI